MVRSNQEAVLREIGISVLGICHRVAHSTARKSPFKQAVNHIDDGAQAAALRIVEKVAAMPSDEAHRSKWLNQTAASGAVDFYRWVAHRADYKPIEDLNLLAEDSQVDYAAVEAQVEAIENETEKAVFRHRMFDRLSWKQIEHKTNVPAVTARRIAARVRQRLMDQWEFREAIGIE
jgi:DNA-directed RNA polymerase specialized sigma24 family protein